MLFKDRWDKFLSQLCLGGHKAGYVPRGINLVHKEYYLAHALQICRGSVGQCPGKCVWWVINVT